jgi:hypothetical protein
VTAQFWLATFERKRPSRNRVEAGPPLLTSPIDAEKGPFAIAVDVWRLADEFAVFVSNADSVDAPTTLECRICFANSTQACDDLRDRGFPAIEARAEWHEEAGELKIYAPFFSDAERMEQPPSTPILTLRDVRFTVSPDQKPLEIAYAQSRVAPARDQPDKQLATRKTIWGMRRSSGPAGRRAGIPVVARPARYPSLHPLPTNHRSNSSTTTVWSGALAPVVEEAKGLSQAVRGLVEKAREVRSIPGWPYVIPIQRPIQIKPRTDAFFAPAYRFDDVEVIGFRVDLGEFGNETDELLADLVAPLNFHLTESAYAGSDFRYRPASRTLMIELLRYGKMRLDRPTPPLSTADFQSQHELLVRLLVGVVDDGTAQARKPATFVPAIFVDNPWSKLLGREVQGFDKRLAQFCVGGDQIPLSSDGRLPDARPFDAPQRLGNVQSVRLVDRLGHVARDTPPVLALDCAPEKYANWDEFDSIDMRLALVNSAFFGAQWRQSDFDAVEFRRSFARTVFTESLLGFRSIQVSPVDNRGLDKAWINGRFTIDDVQVVFPAGVATLTLQEVESAPRAWNRLCRFMSGGGMSAEIDLPTGDWYRMKCSTDLRVDDGPVDIALAW